MKQQQFSKITLVVLVFCISAVFLRMIHQFLMAIFMAGLFSAIMNPFHEWLTAKTGGRENLASLLTVFGIIALVLAPISILITVVFSQAITISQSVTPWVQTFITEPTTASEYLQKIPYYQELLPYRDILIQKTGQLVATLSSFLIDSLSHFTKLTIDAIFSSIIMLYVMFYFLVMGENLLIKILYFLPLDDTSEMRLLRRFTSVTRATLKGTVIIGIIQGGLCGAAFALAGIQGPVFWGAIMAVMSIVPAFGTAIVWFPAACILALQNDFSGFAILIVICGLVAGNLDNLIRPRLVGKDTEMHDLFVLFGTLGGISMFGILGIIIGPIVAALFITIWEIYGDTFSDCLYQVNGIRSRSSKTTPDEEREKTEQIGQNGQEKQ
ncbi:MAG: AI-2E family transporter [Deltaproteobacteria bacterium]|nr:MAG: AI-2E family transporter [Deltaproteobacteria bacterium]